MATGCLSVPRMPELAGLEDFAGPWYHTGQWPHEGVDFSGQRVGVIGTGSSGIQSIPQIASQADSVTVFQRTANFSVPAVNHPLTAEDLAKAKDEFPDVRHEAERQGSIGNRGPKIPSALELDPEERLIRYQEHWDMGGPVFLSSFRDLLVNPESNDTAAEFVRSKIHEKVTDPEVAEILSPKDHPFGTKRICVDIEYFETYNRDSVSLVDIRQTPIERITPSGVRLEDGREFEFDALVFATGFDAMTGALLRVDIQGVEGAKLADEWEHGPRSYLGLMVNGFPNLFTITGPGSPSVLSNMMISIEQHVDWISDCLEHLRQQDMKRMEATAEAQEEWVEHVAAVGDKTLFPRANSWYVGANIPGKPRVFMPYVGGVGPYREKCDEVAANGYEGFALSGSAVAASS